MQARRTFALCVSAVGFVVGCEDGPIAPPSPEPPTSSALIAVSMDGRVGVLLDEFPESIRDRVAQAIIDKPESFWTNRAKDQFRLTGFRFNFRHFYYPPEEGRSQLPIPPESAMRFHFNDDGPKRSLIDGHDLIVLDFRFESYLLTTADSVPISEPALGDIGGTWDEPFVLPVDPTLIFERTGYACLSEADYPPDSVSTENAYVFFDDTCVAELPTAPLCHFTLPGPDESCVEALERAIGRVEASMHFERVEWDESIAAQYRVGTQEQPDYSDLAVRSDFLERNHIVYRYFETNACELQEQCIGAPGWRRLLAFDSVDENIGGQPVHIGPVDYYIEGGDVENSFHGMYEYSACHEHYHFKYYGDFGLSDVPNTIGYKTGFCLVSTDRLSNHELSPISHPYGACTFQGIEAGWGDKYAAGIPCQWLDITEAGIKEGPPVQATLSFRSNPGGFLCEGTPVLDNEGNQIWEPTEFKTDEGKTVDRPQCEFFEGSEDNDVGELTLPVGAKGGVMTSPCQRAQLGPNRNCEFKELDDTMACAPGTTVNLLCSNADPTKPQALRVCDYSIALGVGVTCSADRAHASAIVAETDVPVSFKCPGKRDDVEVGGRYTLFSGPVWTPDGFTDVMCVPAP